MAFRDPTRDIVRGLTSLEMTFVNISSLPWTAHASYIGPTPGITYADTIFPCFAFLSGMSPTPVHRSVGLIGIGLSLHSLNAFINTKPVRIPGVLQRLGLASIIANEPRLQFLREFDGLPLVVLWYAISLLGSSSETSNPLAHPAFSGSDVSDTAQTRADLSVFGTSHLYTPTFDPEGLLGALTTATSMLIGKMFVSETFSAKSQVIYSLVMISVGEALHILLPRYAPISKNLWTPSFVLVSSGLSILKYVAIDALVPYLPYVVRSVLDAVGRRSLEIYILSQLVTMGLNYGGGKSLRSRVREWFGRFVGLAGGDFIISLSLTGVMAASATILVNNHLRLRL